MWESVFAGAGWTLTYLWKLFQMVIATLLITLIFYGAMFFWRVLQGNSVAEEPEDAWASLRFCIIRKGDCHAGEENEGGVLWRTFAPVRCTGSSMP